MENPIHKIKIEKRIADPIHGLIRLTAIESRVVENEFFQRLRQIKQLGIADYVYPGATHTRFSHSLGVLNNVTIMFDAAYKNWIRNPDICGDIDAENLFSDENLQIARLAALCHDLGHLPFSHNLEPAIDWMAKSKLIPSSFKHEKISASIVSRVLSSILGDKAPIIASLIMGDYFNNEVPMFSNFLISSAIDADRMDYLIRDAHYCGVDYGRFDKERLLDSIYPYSVKIGSKNHDILAIHSKGIEAVEQFLLARHRMHQTIYFNRTVVGFEAGLRRAYYQISTNNPPWELPHVFCDEPEKLLEFDEPTFLTQLKEGLAKQTCWLKDVLLRRQSIRKMGPFFYTSIKLKKLPDEDAERYNLLIELKDRLEKPEKDWYQKDHWVYVEHKKQTLVDPVPKVINNEYAEYDDYQNLKNTVLLIGNNRKLIDPTKAGYGHTFLPFISGYSYHRFLFFCHKNDTDRLKLELKPLFDRYEDYQWQQHSLSKYF